MKRALIALLIAAGCTPEEEPIPKVSVAQVSAGAYAVELLTATRLETGMTPIYLRITSDGEPVTDATVTFEPLMTMTEMSHSAPVIGPPVVDPEGDYRCDVVFQMPTGTSGSWSATVGITRGGGPEVEVEFPSLEIADSGRSKVFTYTDPNTAAATKYVTSLNFVDAPKVGLNPVVLTLHRRETAMAYPAVDDATFTLEPWMPSMGHGSPGSVAPALTSQGRYEGELSLSMGGEWETTVTIRRGDITVGTVKYLTDF